MKGASHEERNTFLIISLSVPKRRNVSDKSVETIEIHIVCYIYIYIYIYFENRVVCEIIWKNIVDTGRHYMLDT